MAIPANTTAIGGVTKKSQYDALYNSAILCDTGGTPGGAQTIPGIKTFTDGIAYIGNNAIGITNSDVESWDSSFYVLEMPLNAFCGNSSGTANIVSNAYYDGAWKYKAAGAATDLRQSDNAWSFFYASAGSENGAITWVKFLEIDPVNDDLNLGGAAGGSDRTVNIYFSSTEYLRWDESATNFYLNEDLIITGNVQPAASVIGTADVGTATSYWDDVNCCDVLDRSALFLIDGQEAYNIIKNAINEEDWGHCAKCESRGQKRLKYSHFPSYIWDDALIEVEEDIIFDETMKINEQSYKNRNREKPNYKQGEIIAKKGDKTRLRVYNRSGEKEILLAAEGMSLGGMQSIILTALRKTIINQEKIIQKIGGI